MKAIAIIAAALLSGHHQVVHTSSGHALFITQLACPVRRVPNYHVVCVDGRVEVRRLAFSAAVGVSDLPGSFRRLTVVNRFGRLAGWVDWRRSDPASPAHLAVGSMVARGTEYWQFS